jgi:hypothetical protein
MLSAVLEEMDGERAFPEAAPQPMPRAEPSFEPVAPVASAPKLDQQMVEDMLAERDAQIAELQQAIIELSTQQDEAVAAAVRPELAAMQEQLVRMDAKLFEQERTIRHTLTMLIEWIEGEMEPSKAA